MSKIIGVLLSLFLSSAALAQTIQQSGTVTPGHAVRWTTSGIVQDAGTAANGSLTSLGVTASGPGICQNSAAITGPYQQICLGATTAGGGTISLQNYGGASASPLKLIVNGVSFQFPTTLGTSGQFLQTNGAGVTSWQTASGGGGTPGGSNTQCQYNNAGSFGGITGCTSNGTAVTLVAPVLGTPASATLTNATGLPISTGVSGLGTGIATFLATPSSANLAAALTDETGTGVAVFNTSPSLTTPSIAGGALSGTFSGTPTLSGANFVTNANLVQSGAATIKGNPTASLANASDFTIQGLTARGAPDATNDKLLLFDNAAGTFKYVTPAQIASSATAGVSSLNSLTGALNLVAGTNITITPLGTNITIDASGGGSPGGSNTQCQYNNSGAFGGITGCTSNGTAVTLVAPVLGTPASATLTNATGLPISTGVSGLGTGVATFLATPSSANLAAALTDETGTGAAVFANGPTLIAPVLGTPASGTATNLTGLPISTGVSGLGTGVATFLATPSSANLASAVTDETGTGALVFGTGPTITLANGTGLPISTGVSGLGTGVATFLATPSSANLAAALTDETGTGAAVFAGSPTLTGTVTAAALTLSSTLTTNVTGGGTQCLQASNTGVVSGTAGACSGGSAVLDYRNLLYANGSFEVWQRGAGAMAGNSPTASFAIAASTTTGQYTADRWYVSNGASETLTVTQQVGLVNQSAFSARVARNSGQTGTTILRFAYPFESEECQRLRGQNITLQFYTSTGANWSPTSGTLTYTFYTGTGTNQKRNGSAYTGEATPLTSSVNLSTSAAAAQTTFTGLSTVATTTTQCELQFNWTPTGTAGANDWLQLDEVQLETGSTATTFERTSFRIQLTESQRHFAKTFNYTTAPAQNAGIAGALLGTDSGAPAGTMAGGIAWQFAVNMRTAPTMTLYNPSAANAQARGLVTTSDATGTAAATASTAGVYITNSGISNGSVSQPIIIHAQADAGL